jgi:hypothetical protein
MRRPRFLLLLLGPRSANSILGEVHSERGHVFVCGESVIEQSVSAEGTHGNEKERDALVMLTLLVPDFLPFFLVVVTARSDSSVVEDLMPPAEKRATRRQQREREEREKKDGTDSLSTLARCLRALAGHARRLGTLREAK